MFMKIVKHLFNLNAFLKPRPPIFHGSSIFMGFGLRAALGRALWPPLYSANIWWRRSGVFWFSLRSWFCPLSSGQPQETLVVSTVHTCQGPVPVLSPWSHFLNAPGGKRSCQPLLSSTIPSCQSFRLSSLCCPKAPSAGFESILCTLSRSVSWCQDNGPTAPRRLCADYFN